MVALVELIIQSLEEAQQVRGHWCDFAILVLTLSFDIIRRLWSLTFMQNNFGVFLEQIQQREDVGRSLLPGVDVQKGQHVGVGVKQTRDQVHHDFCPFGSGLDLEHQVLELPHRLHAISAALTTTGNNLLQLLVDLVCCPLLFLLNNFGVANSCFVECSLQV